MSDDPKRTELPATVIVPPEVMEQTLKVGTIDEDGPLDEDWATLVMPPPDPPTVAGADDPDGDVVAAFAEGLAVAGEHGRLRAGSVLGKGGMGQVLEVHDPALGRSVALKIALTDEDDALRRFVQEAQITSQLEHPNIVPVYDAGQTADGAPWYAMQKVEGRTLTGVLGDLARGDADPEEWSQPRLLGAFVQICNAIAYAHDRGVLHRDIKPDNIMFGRFGEVLVVDWGVARLLGASTGDEPVTKPGELAPVPVSTVGASGGTLVGSAVGTPGYMSPEATQGELHRLGPQSDVFSLGAVLFEICTLQRAYKGQNLMQILFASTRGDPPDPRERAPGRDIDDELARIVMNALRISIRERTPTARLLGRQVQDFLEGRLRRLRAVAELEQGRTAWEHWTAQGSELAAAAAALAVLEEQTPAWTPREAKTDLLDARLRVKDLEAERNAAFADALAGAERALSHDPTYGAAHDLLADASWTAFVTAEEAGDRAAAAAWGARVEAHDRGRYAERLAGQGTLLLRTDPPGADVICERYERRGLVWPLVGRSSLGATPLTVPLAMGSYRLRLTMPGRAVVTYPVHITRGRRWEGPVVSLPTMDAIPPGEAYVAPGPFTRGGDPDAQDGTPRAQVVVDGFVAQCLPVTAAEYAEFLTALHRTDPDGAWGRAPRNPTGDGTGGQYWEQPDPGEPYRVPKVDRDGDAWDPRWPCMGVCWGDATAYAAWRAQRDGLPWRLPTEDEWEKMARGTDGRLYPWGDEFDATLCNMRTSHPDRPRPMPVGAVPEDASIYGVRDVAGNQQEFCGDAHYGGNEVLRAARGGSWTSDGMRCRTTWRQGYRPGVVRTVAGFRLVRSLG